MRTYCLWDEIKNIQSTTKCLKDCRVVIDGQNYFFRTYENSNLPYVFGAEADKYADYLKKKLDMFSKANVKCYIIFKGSDTDINKKLNKLWLTTFDFEKNYSFASPVFVKQIYQQVLEEMGVKHAVSVTESKDDCVALAKELQCPVISEDKEFYFKGVPYIPYTSMNYTPSNSSISCQQYHLKNFLRQYSLTDRKEAIFLALSDVTVFPRIYFNRLLQKISNNGARNSMKMELKEILIWLSRRTEHEALRYILNLFETGLEQNKFLTYVETVEKVHQDSNVVLNHLRSPITNNNNQAWFAIGVAQQKIAVEYIYLYKYKCMMGSWAIERNDSVDSIMLSIDIIKYAYNLLKNFQPSHSIRVYQNSKKYTTVYTEHNDAKPAYECNDSVFENGWTDVKHLKLFEHFLISKNIDVDKINQLPTEARMLFIALVFFARKKKSEKIIVKKEVYCFIVSYVMLNIVFDEEVSARRVDSGITVEDSHEAKSLAEEYFRYDLDEAKRIFNKDTLKTLVELQYCLLHMNYLNSLCGSPYMTTKYSRTFNGTFVYKLLKDMDGNDEERFITAMFRNAPTVLEFLNTLIEMYKKVL